MDSVDRPPSGASWLRDIFESERQTIQSSMQSEIAENLSFDIYQAAEAMECSGRILNRLQSNPTSRSLNHIVLATTAHIFGIMSARPLTCRHASASHVDYVNANFAAISAFIRLKMGSFLKIDQQIMRRFIMNFHGRATWPEPFGQNLGADLERDLSTMLFFFEAYMRPGFGQPYKFRNPRHRYWFRRSI
jgi:hypothetical protein